MGIIKKGILGGFSGKVGQVVGSSWRGLDVMRSLPKKSNSEPSNEQLEQRQKFGLVVNFLSPLKGMLEKTYGRVSGSKSKFNLALSYHIQEAITGVMPNLEIDFSKVVLSRGELLGPKAATVAVNTVAEINFNWQANSGTGLSSDDDQVIMVLYNPSKKLHVVEQGSTKRVDLSLTLQVPTLFSGDVVHGWMAFLSASGKDSSTSVYLGKVTVL
ncbi:DUF6266 family protein [Pedobacter sp. GR22-10]|uniref:DUF6266 family protein n=1 Tax=Pedobacter sp. GR22-10 TaxID=2994472 RepID=UPI002246662D|nr:DUF6266 family protein [Pedobacter sp. GR22-10]MCX2430164.1 DUF6266 family protein [Pedobacter sp. GR22-10]